MRKMQKVYQDVFQDFVNNVNALGGQNESDNHVKIYLNKAFDKSTLSTHDLMGSDKLLISFSTPEMKKIYGFHLSPDLDSKEKAPTTLGFSDSDARALEVSYMFDYDKVVHQNEDEERDRFHLMSTFREANSFNGYGYMFDLATDPNSGVWSLNENNQYVELFDAVKEAGKDAVDTLVEFTEDDVEKTRFFGVQGLCMLGETDKAKECLNKMLGLDNLYEILKRTNDELNSDPKKVPDLLADIAADPKAALGLNTVAMYSEFYKNWLENPNKDKSHDISISDDMYENVSFINLKRESRQINLKSFSDVMAGKTTAGIRCYNRMITANTTVASEKGYSKANTITYPEQYRLYASALKGQKYTEAMNVPAAYVYMDDNKNYRIITDDSKEYSLHEFAYGGFTKERNDEIQKLRDGFPCLWNHATYMKAHRYSENDVVKSLNDMCSHVALLNAKNMAKVTGGSKSYSCDMLAVEFRCFENDVIKAENSRNHEILADILKEYKEVQLQTRNDDKLYSFTKQHQIGLPSFESGSLEFGKLIENEIKTEGKKNEGMKDIISQVDDFGDHAYDLCSRRALTFRKDDLTYKMFDKLREQSDLPKSSSFEDVILKNPEVFAASSHYISAWNRLVSDFNKEPDNYDKLGKLNDFIIMTDVYDPKSVESIDRIVKDIDRVYDNSVQKYDNETLYRPKDQNEINVLRVLCGDDYISKYGTATVTGPDMTFDKVVKNTVSVLLENDEFDKIAQVEKELYQSARMSDTAKNPAYLNLYADVRAIKSSFDYQDQKEVPGAVTYSKFDKLKDTKNASDEKWAEDKSAINKDMTED